MSTSKKARNIKWLKASSLIEALFALVILTIITTFILLIMSNVNNKSNVGLKTRAFNEVNNIFNRSIRDKNYSERSIDFKNFYVSCQANEYIESDKLIVFKVSAFYSNGKIILSKQCLVKTENNIRVKLNSGSNTEE